MSKIYLLAIFALSLSEISTVRAATFNNFTGLAGQGISSISLNFDSAPGLTTNSQLVNNFAFAGVNFTTPAFYDGNSAGGGCAFNDFGGDCITNYSSAPGSGLLTAPTVPFSILFATPQSYAAFALVTDNNGLNNTTFTAYNGSTVVDQFTATTGSSGGQGVTVPNYFGFYNESIQFDRITFTTSGMNLLIIDNLQYQAVPEPGTIGMLALGLGGIVTLISRRRRVS